ncbi:MAG: hypothetical protein SFT68_02995 [Rickettsiaceae bacterium]|nr:hypothetical protein [Rickettsiaceae bacterium]
MQTSVIKTFARRVGKGFSASKKNAISNILPKFKVDINNLTKNAENPDKIILEIGIGMSEHFINQAKINQQNYYIGAEPYLNGIANCIQIASSEGVNNIGLWPDSADDILELARPETFDIIYLLFPDPWPKQRQQKRRFGSFDRIEKIKKLLKNNGHFIFASDIAEYFTSIKQLAQKAGMKEVIRDENTPHDGYVTTRFHQKAIKEGRNALFSIWHKIGADYSGKYL